MARLTATTFAHPGTAAAEEQIDALGRHARNDDQSTHRDLRMNEGSNHLTEDMRGNAVTAVVARLVVVLVGAIIPGREDRVIRTLEVVAIRRERPARHR